MVSTATAVLTALFCCLFGDVSPLQGSKHRGASFPRASPWAIMSRPFGASGGAAGVGVSGGAASWGEVIPWPKGEVIPCP